MDVTKYNDIVQYWITQVMENRGKDAELSRSELTAQLDLPFDRKASLFVNGLSGVDGVHLSTPACGKSAAECSGGRSSPDARPERRGR